MTAPTRIASLISSATEILFGLGLGDRVVAVSHECDYPAAVSNLPRVTVANIDSSQDSQTIDDQVQQMSGTGAALYGQDKDTPKPQY